MLSYLILSITNSTLSITTYTLAPVSVRKGLYRWGAHWGGGEKILSPAPGRRRLAEHQNRQFLQPISHNHT